MKMKDPVRSKSLNFTVSVVQLCCLLKAEKQEHFFSRLLLRCGTAVGSAIEKAVSAVSEKEFRNCYSQAYNEAIESIILLKLLKSSGISDPELTDHTITECEVLIKALESSLRPRRVHSSA